MLCSESRKAVQTSLEKKGIKFKRKLYGCECENLCHLNLQGVRIEKVKFKYLVSTVQSNRGYNCEVKRHDQEDDMAGEEQQM